jgi:hypothetical protein
VARAGRGVPAPSPRRAKAASEEEKEEMCAPGIVRTFLLCSPITLLQHIHLIGLFHRDVFQWLKVPPESRNVPYYKPITLHSKYLIKIRVREPNPL